jgi:hypothetical protein
MIGAHFQKDCLKRETVFFGAYLYVMVDNDLQCSFRH